ncbi:MAG: hypothetical protein AB1457_16170 [Chloroflexota bacterium]
MNNKEVLERLNTALDGSGVPIRGRGKAIVEKTGYSSGMVSRYLSGQEAMSDNFLKAVCTKFGLSERYIIKGEGEPLEDKFTQYEMEIFSALMEKIDGYLREEWKGRNKAGKLRFYADILDAAEIRIIAHDGKSIVLWATK